MNEPTEIISPNKKDNVFITRIKKYQIITITMAFLLLYRTFDHLIYYFKEGNSPYQAIGLARIILTYSCVYSSMVNIDLDSFKIYCSIPKRKDLWTSDYNTYIISNIFT